MTAKEALELTVSEGQFNRYQEIKRRIKVAALEGETSVHLYSVHEDDLKKLRDEGYKATKDFTVAYVSWGKS